MNDPFVAINLEGGIIQSVTIIGAPQLPLIVLDYDTQGASQQDLTRIPQTVEGGEVAEYADAYVNVGFTEPWPASPASPVTRWVKERMNGTEQKEKN